MVTINFRKVLAEERKRREQGATTDSCSATSEAAFATASARPELRELSSYDVGSEVLQGLRYIPSFLTEHQQAQLLARIDAAPGSRWVQAEGRRIQNWGGRPGAWDVSEELPDFLQSLLKFLVNTGIYGKHELPNHCLINSYTGGAPCPMHQDGPLYDDKVVTLTLGGPAMICFHRQQPDGSGGGRLIEALLQPGCCFSVTGDAYSKALHCIEEASEDEITELCCNRSTAGVMVGMRVPREPRRVSLVFVRKTLRT